MNIERPDLSQADPALIAYVAALEAEVARLRAAAEAVSEPEASPEPPEAPTTVSLITISRAGMAKRTPVHLYGRQRRGGMGIFDLDTPESDPPARLVVADEVDRLVVFTRQAAAFHLPVSQLPSAPVRSRGQSLPAMLGLPDDEPLAAVMPESGQAYMALLSETGHIRVRPAHLVGRNLQPGVALLRVEETGPLAAACWADGDSDLFVATRRGTAIRFSLKAVPHLGATAIRLEAGDAILGVCAVRPESGVFLLGTDGQGTIRLMSGFAPNKAPGGGGKTAMKTESLAGLALMTDGADLFAITTLGKIIRFRASEVPAKEGVVQGVACVQLRADHAAAVTLRPA